jgi:outer membrane protein TolC
MTLFLAFVSLFAGAQDLPPGSTLTLDQALAYADRNAFAILIQKTRVEKGRQETLAQIGKLGPTAYLSGNFTRFDAPTTASFNGNTLTIVPIETLSLGPSVTMPIDISGNMHRLIRASRANQYAQRETLEADRSETRRAVRTAYYAILRAEHQVTVAQEALASDTASATNVEQRFKAGILAEVDVMRAQTQQASSESNVIAAKNGLELAKQNLNNLLAQPIEADFSVVDVPLPSITTPDVTVLTVQAEHTRHEAKALEQTLSALTETRKYIQGQNLPSLNLGASYTYNAPPIGFGTRPEVAAGTLSLNWPILDSGYYRAEVRAARQDEEQARLQLKQARLQISLDVRQANANLVNANARLAVAGRQIATATVALNEARLRQEQGLGILLEVIEAQRDLTNAEFAQVSARYDVLQATADLQRAVGDDTL